MTIVNPAELELNAELLNALKLAGLEILWHPGQATISSDFKFESPCSAKWMDIKSGVEIGAYSYAVSGHFQRVVIGRYSSIGEDVQFGRGNHSSFPISNSPIFSLSGPLFSNSENWRSSRLPTDVLPQEDLPTTYVGSDVWVGHGAFIKPGVVIGDGAIVGAASVVTKNVAPFSIVAGNPARLIRMRYPDVVIESLLRVKWWNYEISALDGIDFSDLSDVLEKVSKLGGKTGKNLHRTVEEFVFTKDEIDKFGSSGHRFLKHHSGFEYAIVNSPHRFRADYLFNIDRSMALHHYSQSVQSKEPGKIYTFLNGANCAPSLGQLELAGTWLAEGINCRYEDSDYFGEVFPHALWRFLSFKEPNEALAYLAQIGFSSPNQSTIDLRRIVIGFPRCGTTTVASLFQEDSALQNGLTFENFPSLLGRSLEMDSLFKSYEISLLFGSVIRQDGNQSNKFVDKSTILCLSKQLISELIMRYPEAEIYAVERDPFDRSISAFKRSQARFTSTLWECVQKELEVIESLGGVRSIFESINLLAQYLRGCLDFRIDYPLIYPSLLMKHWLTLTSEDLQARISVVSVFGKTELISELSIENLEVLPILNSSDPLRDDLSSRDIETLQKALNDESLI